MAKVLFISKGIDSASTRYRALQYFPYLQANNFNAEHSTISGGLTAVLHSLWRASQADIVIVLRKTFPLFITKLLRLVSKKLIFDFDDAIFCSSSGAGSTTRMKRFADIVRCSDHVFAGNQFLADAAIKFNNKVTVIPTSLTVAKYQGQEIKPKDTIDLVWIGSQSTSKYLIDILPLLEKLSLEYPKLRLKIIADFDLPDAKVAVLALPWNEEEEAKELLSADIGIAPMIDNQWTRGKCALKVLQYMAAKLPVISSNVGVNGEAVIDTETGLLVDSDEQWLSAINTLLKDQKLRTIMGESGHNRVATDYDIEIVFQKILEVIKQL